MQLRTAACIDIVYSDLSLLECFAQVGNAEIASLRVSLLALLWAVLGQRALTAVVSALVVHGIFDVDEQAAFAAAVVCSIVLASLFPAEEPAGDSLSSFAVLAAQICMCADALKRRQHKGASICGLKQLWVRSPACSRCPASMCCG